MRKPPAKEVQALVSAIATAADQPSKGGGPKALQPPPPMRGTAVTVQSSRGSAFPAVLLFLAVMAGGMRFAVLRWHPAEPSQAKVLQVVRDHSGWAYPAALATVLLAIGLMVLRSFRRRHDADATRVTSAISAVLRLPGDQIGLRRTKWLNGQLQSTHITYPRGSVLGDLSAELAAALQVFAVGPLTVTWFRREDRFEVVEKPVVEKRLEERSPAVKSVFESLSHIISGLKVDQVRTELAADGSIAALVASYPHTTRDIGDGFQQRVRAVLDAKSPSPTGYWSLSWDPATNTVTVTPSQPLPQRAPYPLALPPGDRLLIPVGVGVGGVDKFWAPTVNPHMLAVGPTGSGKTNFINGVIVGVLARRWRVLLADPKELSFRGFDPAALAAKGLDPWPGIEMVATTEADMERAIDMAYQEMRRRYQALKNFAIREQDLEPWLFIIDETGELAERLNAYQTTEQKFLDMVAAAVAGGMDPEEAMTKVGKPKGGKNPELLKIWSLLRLGRQALIIVEIATQRPDVTFIPGEARSNLVCRVGLGKLDAQALEMVYGTRAVQQRLYEMNVDPETGQRKRTRVRGRATIDLGDGPETVQTYWSPDPAKAITGELSQADQDTVEAMRQFIIDNRERWTDSADLDGVVVPPSKAVDLESWSPEELETVWGSGDEPVDLDAADMQGCRADQLEEGQEVLIEVDRKPTLVVIEEIEPDPYSEPGDNELQVTYRISDSDPRGGQGGVTTLVGSEIIQVSDLDL